MSDPRGGAARRGAGRRGGHPRCGPGPRVLPRAGPGRRGSTCGPEGTPPRAGPGAAASAASVVGGLTRFQTCCSAALSRSIPASGPFDCGRLGAPRQGPRPSRLGAARPSGGVPSGLAGLVAGGGPACSVAPGLPPAPACADAPPEPGRREAPAGVQPRPGGRGARHTRVETAAKALPVLGLLVLGESLRPTLLIFQIAEVWVYSSPVPSRCSCRL